MAKLALSSTRPHLSNFFQVQILIKCKRPKKKISHHPNLEITFPSSEKNPSGGVRERTELIIEASHTSPREYLHPAIGFGFSLASEIEKSSARILQLSPPLFFHKIRGGTYWMGAGLTNCISAALEF